MLRIFALSTSLFALACIGCKTDDRTDRPPAPPEAAAPGLRATPNISGPLELPAPRVRGALALRPVEGGAHAGRNARYALSVAKTGVLAVTPRHRARGALVEGAPLRLETTSIRRRSRELIQGPPAIRATTVGLELRRGAVVEELRPARTGVEQRWRFAARPAGAGDLVVAVRAAGASYLAVTAGGLHFAARQGALGLRYGHATWVDARGRRTELRARHRAGVITLRVPAAVVDASDYPALLDPFISPELGLDNPANGPANAGQWRPRVAYDGSHFLAAWDDYRKGTDTDIYGARVTPAGALVDKTGIVISAVNGNENRTSVTFDGTNYLVVWEDARGTSTDIYGARISKAGALLDTAGIPIATSVGAQYAPHAIHDGSNFVVIWPDRRNGTDFDLYFARVSAAGSVLDAGGVPISKAVGDQSEPVAVHNGTDTLVVWNDSRGADKDIYAARLSKAGAVLDSAGIPVSAATGDQQAPQLAYDGSTYLAVWYDARGGSSTDIYGARITAAGSVLDATGIPISTATDAQSWPSISYGGSDYLVAWQDRRSGATFDVYAARVSKAGAVLDTTGVPISTAAGDQTRPDIGFGGTDYLIFWSDTRNGDADIRLSRVTSAATVLDKDGQLISTAGNEQLNPTAAFDGSNYLIVWQDNRAGDSADIWAARLSKGAKVLDPTGIAVSQSSGDQIRPSVTYDGTNFVVVWEDLRSSSSSGADIYGARVSSAGVVLDSTGVPISTASGDQGRPVVTRLGGNVLALWQDKRGGTNADIYGARISPAATVLDASGMAISTASGDQLRPAVAVNAGMALVTWEDGRQGAVQQIFGARVNSSGIVLDTQGLAITKGSASSHRPAVVQDGSAYFVAWRTQQSGSQVALGVRVNASGAPASSAPLLLAANTSGTAPLRLIAGDSKVLAVWRQPDPSGVGTNLGGVRIADGALLGTKPFTIVKGSWSVDDQDGITLAAAGAQYMLAYAIFDSSADQRTTRIRARILTWKQQASACSQSEECSSGYCVDGFCCDKSCGGGSSSDCQACGKSAGGASDGTCGPVVTGAICRPSAGICDSSESCDGTTLACPADTFKAATTVCRPVAGVCDGEERCAGSAASCPADLPAVDGTPCPGGSCKGGSCIPLPDAGPPDQAVVTPDASPDLTDAAPAVDSSPDDVGPDADAATVDAADVDARVPPPPKIGFACRVLSGEGSRPPLTSLAVLALLLLLWRRGGGGSARG